MNKLYCVKFMIGEMVLSCKNFWSEEEAKQCSDSWKGEWAATIVEDNAIHKIWEMR